MSYGALDKFKYGCMGVGAVPPAWATNVTGLLTKIFVPLLKGRIVPEKVALGEIVAVRDGDMDTDPHALPEADPETDGVMDVLRVTEGDPDEEKDADADRLPDTHADGVVVKLTEPELHCDAEGVANCDVEPRSTVGDTKIVAVTDELRESEPHGVLEVVNDKVCSPDTLTDVQIVLDTQALALPETVAVNDSVGDTDGESVPDPDGETDGERLLVALTDEERVSLGLADDEMHTVTETLSLLLNDVENDDDSELVMVGDELTHDVVEGEGASDALTPREGGTEKLDDTDVHVVIEPHTLTVTDKDTVCVGDTEGDRDTDAHGESVGLLAPEMVSEGDREGDRLADADPDSVIETLTLPLGEYTDDKVRVLLTALDRVEVGGAETDAIDMLTDADLVTESLADPDLVAELLRLVDGERDGEGVTEGEVERDESKLLDSAALEVAFPVRLTDADLDRELLADTDLVTALLRLVDGDDDSLGVTDSEIEGVAGGVKKFCAETV